MPWCERKQQEVHSEAPGGSWGRGRENGAISNKLRVELNVEVSKQIGPRDSTVRFLKKETDLNRKKKIAPVDASLVYRQCFESAAQFRLQQSSRCEQDNKPNLINRFPTQSISWTSLLMFPSGIWSISFLKFSEMLVSSSNHLSESGVWGEVKLNSSCGKFAAETFHQNKTFYPLSKQQVASNHNKYFPVKLSDGLFSSNLVKPQSKIFPTKKNSQKSRVGHEEMALNVVEGPIIKCNNESETISASL